MADTEETEHVAEVIEQTNETNGGDDSGEPDTKPAEATTGDSKDLMGEIMDMVRTGSPQDKTIKLDHDESISDSAAVEQEDKVTEENEKSTPNEPEVEEDSEKKEDSKEEEEVKSKGDKKEEGEAAIDATEAESSPTLEQIQEEKEIVTPHLLSDEDIIARGVAESDIEMYRKFHLKVCYSPKAWYDVIKDHTFSTEFIVLSPEEISALIAIYHSPNEEAPSVTDEVKAVIAQLQEKIDGIITTYGEEGAFVKINTHSAKDAVLDRCDQDHIQAVEDGIQNELEIEQQFVNAYLNWRSWRSMSYRENSRTKLPSDQQHRGNVVRRSFRRIQKTLNRPRPSTEIEQSTDANNESKGNDAPLAEETAKDDEKEENKDEKKEEETKGETDDKKEENEAGETDKEADVVTIEATVEKTEATDGADEDQLKQDTSEEKLEEKKEEEKETPAEEEIVAQKETPAEEEKSEDPTGQTVEETKEESATAEIEEVKPKEEVTDKADEDKKQGRVPPPHFLGKEQQFIKVKAETRGNKILRAFIKATAVMYKVTTGEKAIELLSTSRIIKEDLEQATVFANISGTCATLSIQRWHADVAKYPGMQFRAFVYKSKLNALSQKDDVAYIPNIVRYKDTIKTKIVHFFNNTVRESFKEFDSYVVDIFVGSNKIYVTDLYPFSTGTGACLFTWQQNKTVMLNGPLVFHHVPTPYKNCFTGLQPHWQQVCTNSQQKKTTKEPNSGKCVIL